LFDHTVVTLVTDKLKRQWLHERFSLVSEINCIRLLEKELAQFILQDLQPNDDTPSYLQPKES